MKLKDHPKYCVRCGQFLDPSSIVWLELNNLTNTYHEPGKVREQESQGAFPFGAQCAKMVLASGGRLDKTPN